MNEVNAPLIKGLPPVRGRLNATYPLAGLSWLRVGGPAEVLFQPADLSDLQSFLAQLDEDIPIMVIGVCSNLIIRDNGVDGVVVRLGRGFNQIKIEPDGTLTLGAAALDAQVAKRAALAGVDLAFLRTIPGTIGGAIKMNAGCYGQYLADVFVKAQALNRKGELRTLTADDLCFAYRQSNLPDDMILINATLRAPLASPAEIEIKMQQALDHRAKTQPVDEKSCGSTFRNPVGYSSSGVVGEDHSQKAWKLIESAGMRGASLGGAQISEKHPNFLINANNATAADLEKLGEEVRKKVAQTHKIALEWEIKRVGKA